MDCTSFKVYDQIIDHCGLCWRGIPLNRSNVELGLGV